jgi:hypothetical protein
MNSRIKLFLFHILIPFLIGGLLYVSFRSKSIRLFSWCETIGLSNYISIIRSVINPYKESIPNWVYYSIPDGLWMYSFTSSYMMLWQKDIYYGKYWLSFPFVFGWGIELSQGLGIIQGTFDVIDLTVYIIAVSFSILFFTIQNNQYEKQKNTI